MRTFLVALLAASLGLPAGSLSAQAADKAAPEGLNLNLTSATRRCMTYARRIENADPGDTEAAANAIQALGEAMDAAGASLEDLAKAVPPGNEALIEQIRKSCQTARPHMDALNGLKDKPLSAAAKQHAAAIREQLDLAEEAHQKLMKALAASKPDTAKPAMPKLEMPKLEIPKPDVPKADTAKPSGA